MAGALLSAADRAYFLAKMRRQLNSAVQRRMNALLLLDDGWPAEADPAQPLLFMDATHPAMTPIPPAAGSGAARRPRSRATTAG
jgi:hypothetical protein